MSTESATVGEDVAGTERATVTENATATESPDTQADGTTPANPAGGGRPSVSRTFRRAGFAVLVVLALGATATAAVFGVQLRDAKAVESAAREASDVARQYAVTLTSVGADLESDFAAVLDGATGEFEKMYAESSEQLRQLLIDNQAQAEGVVVESGIKSATPTKVEVLLFIDQSVTNALVPEPRLDRSRVVMTMELVDGRWLASQVDLP
ncbi:hypothetical protein [Rhodococcus sp. (in: high G+C Gram-positive bacteria)]|uniref:hypothetical protein n=1 Tax=Rhodococcus sp. TaxID=1831 RepID=UPI001A041C26|nr:hypothetical protein [Rhodococcus sp. (in: high G+C Gram-positive bacteria)]MBF0663726.1 hypothetical protein [Rhodococcus sp. (in: high G+C Gram-positive bacteria)]